VPLPLLHSVASIIERARADGGVVAAVGVDPERPEPARGVEAAFTIAEERFNPAGGVPPAIRGVAQERLPPESVGRCGSESLADHVSTDLDV